MKSRTRTIILVHIIAWLIQGIAYFFLAESVAAWIFPGTHDVTMWMATLIVGEIILLILSAISMTISLKRAKKKIAADRLNDQRQ